MSYDHIVINGTIVNSDGEYKGNVHIKDGKIDAISDEVLGEAEKVTDASNQYVLPGLMDTHVHSRDGGATYKEDFIHSTKAAAAGGITTLFEMPNTNPPVNNIENFNKQLENLRSKASINFGLWGICLGDLNLKDIESLNQAGVIGFKYFWGYAVNKDNYQLIYNYDKSMENVIPPCDDGEVYRMFEEVSKTGKKFAVHAENSDLISYLSQKEKDETLNDYDNAVEARPDLAEELTVQTGISMAKTTGTNLHILHVSSKKGIEAVENAQKDGYKITAETCPHYLFLTNKDFEKIGPDMKVYPLVKYQEDQDRLWQAIEDDVITIVCSDHAPHTEEEKDGSLDEIPAGMCGVETLAPLMINAVSEGKITLPKLVALLSANPAKEYGMYPQKGTVQTGSDADITIVDMDQKWKIDKQKLHSKSKVTAYDGKEITGKPVATIINGVTVMENGEIVEELQGKPVLVK